MSQTINRLSPFHISLSVHGAIILVVAIALWPSPQKTVNFDVVYQDPKPALAPQLDLAKPIERKPPPPQKKAVFGLSQKALTLEAQTPGQPSVEVKAGNTVAKEQDDLKLDPNDTDALPIPTDDYLVSEMPRLLGDIRIPYPPEAKKAGVEGAVLMDLLIDPEGTVRQAVLVSGPGSGLDEAAVEAAKKFRFKPGKVRDQNVAVKIRYAYRFVLER